MSNEKRMKGLTGGWSGVGDVVEGGTEGEKKKKTQNNWHEMNCRQSQCFVEHKTVRRG